MGKSEVFEAELRTIVNDDIREFATMLLDNAFDYFYEVAASSSGRYHPKYALGKGGVVRHTKAALIFINFILELEQHSKYFTDREQDCMRVAVIYHDAEKHGKGHNPHTIHEHPLCAAETIRSYKGRYLTEDEIEYIAQCIETHMGQWQTSKRSKVELPKPTNAAQKFVHLADYLASRRNVEVLFEDEKPKEPPTIQNYVMPYGKHKGELFIEIAKNNRSYLRWLKENTELKEPLKGFVDKVLLIDRENGNG